MKTTKDFVKNIAEIYASCLEILEKKNNDYATELDPFKNFRLAELVGMTVEDAILVRMSDKLARISNLVRNDKKAEVKDESIEDTLADLCNYSAILSTYLKWEKEDTPVNDKESLDLLI